MKSRVVTVKGPKGTLTRDFKHMNLDMQPVDAGKQLKVDLWFGNRESIAAIRYVLKLNENCAVTSLLAPSALTSRT